MTAKEDYKLTCLTGCTTKTAAIQATSASSNVLTFDDIFSTQFATGTLIDLYIEGWQNSETQTIYNLYFSTVWKANTAYEIDRFQNLG